MHATQALEGLNHRRHRQFQMLHDLRGAEA